jgi:hypothetical protein
MPIISLIPSSELNPAKIHIVRINPSFTSQFFREIVSETSVSEPSECRMTDSQGILGRFERTGDFLPQFDKS